MKHVSIEIKLDIDTENHHTVKKKNKLSDTKGVGYSVAHVVQMLF